MKQSYLSSIYLYNKSADIRLKTKNISIKMKKEEVDTKKFIH